MLDLSKKPDRPLVAASILASDFAAVGDDCEDVLSKGADLLHLDVMDGHFVGNLTLGADMIKGLRRRFPDVYLDVHLMVDHPAMYIESFAAAGADNFTFHLEVCNPVRARHADPGAVIDAIHSRGMSAGMVINPLTNVEGLAPYLDAIELALVMSVHPGAGGQAFMPETLSKTRWLAERVGPNTRIEMDGGLSPQTVSDAAAAGCEIMVTGSALFGADDRAAVIDKFHSSELGPR